MSQKKHRRFLQLYRPVHDRFERFCRARAYADMPHKDLMNETLLIAYQKLDGLQREASFLAFLIGISIRLLANARKKKKTTNLTGDVALTGYADPTDGITQQFDVAFLHRMLAELPEQQREAIILFELTGFSIKEIMQIQQSGASAVKQRLARGRKALARLVKKEMAITNTQQP